MNYRHRDTKTELKDESAREGDFGGAMRWYSEIPCRGGGR